jgi:hypothetical protein
MRIDLLWLSSISNIPSGDTSPQPFRFLFFSSPGEVRNIKNGMCGGALAALARNDTVYWRKTHARI